MQGAFSWFADPMTFTQATDPRQPTWMEPSALTYENVFPRRWPAAQSDCGLPEATRVGLQGENMDTSLMTHASFE